MGVPEGRLVAIFPSMMAGSKASASVTELQAALTWREMKLKFLKCFEVDTSTVMAEL